MKVKVVMTLGIGMNIQTKEIIELDLPEDYTQDDLDKAWLVWINNYIDGGAYVLEV